MTVDDPETYTALDAKGLRALAHPVRGRIVGLLRKHGPATATQLAQRLGLNSGATSYHLRQLAAAGFIEEDTERGNARERWWRSVHRRQSFSNKDMVERDPEAAMSYLRTVAAGYALRAQQALDEFETMPKQWWDLLDLSDWQLLLTPTEASDLRRELHAVLDRYRQATPDAVADGPEGAERVVFLTQMLPEPGTRWEAQP